MDMGTHRDLISASHDGECTPEERAVVRQLLEQSEAARVEQRECAQISQLLGQLPEQSAPAGFDAQVLQAVEREMLLGHTATAVTPPRRINSLPRLAYLFVGLAAGILLVVGWYGLVDPRWHPLQPRGSMETLAQLDDTSNMLVDQPIEGASGVRLAEEQAMQGVLDEGLAADRPAAASADGDDQVSIHLVTPTTPAGIPENADVANAVPRPAKSLLPGGLLGTSQLEGAPVFGSAARADDAAAFRQSPQPRFRFLRQLNAAQVGEVVEALKVSENDVSVVKLTVVDRWESLAQLRVVLSENQLEAVDQQHLDRQQVDQQQLLVGVFIEASDQELASALSEIQKLDNLQELSVAQSVSLADVSRNLIASHPVTADLTKRVRSRKKGNGKAAAPRSTAPSPNRDVAKAKAANRPEPGDAKLSESAIEADGANRAAKLAIPTPYPIMIKPSLLARRAAPPGSRSGDRAQGAADSRRSGSKSGEQDKVVVLFVLVAENTPKGIDSIRRTKKPPAKPVECGADDSV